MADYDVYQSLETQQEFFEELDDVVATQFQSHDLIDQTLRSWLHLASRFRGKFPQCDDNEVAMCAEKLLASNIFVDNKDYVRTQIIYSLLQEEEAESLHIISCFLLLDGSADEATFSKMVEEACFPRLLELINGRKDADPRLHRSLLELMYEMSRVERLRLEDLLQVDDGLIHYLFQIIEELSNDAHDPYHYSVIRVLLVLNEQYMLACTAITDPLSPTAPLTNRVMKCLSLHGDSFRTFGENIILLLNRETETSLQLLILKLLYLLFTSKTTYEYFYTNDLKVLLDVIIRNLMDLPDEKNSLRHTYLRVLYPLLAHTQLGQPPHYKREEIMRVLRILGGLGNSHFAPADETTLRLVDRVSKVKWLAEGDSSGDAEVARKLLGFSLSRSHTASSVSVVDVAAVMEKPGVQTPSRKADDTQSQREKVVSDISRPAKSGPEVPRHRHGLPFTQPCVPNLQVNGKRTPPKAPPPRRGAKLPLSSLEGSSRNASPPSDC
ncbi:LDB17 protein [Plectosphaerella cucumerina]|uniref:LDB17 protein n=1 Tax=Plectosphaerella cucumerina TaxID=40658 RepID=A0A8K0WZV6_9PEZI|nr:LDB17 protein [Plectosphaerella cucumerina]